MCGLKITVVTAVYNGEEYIEECIKSIMNQTYTNFEHIVMDGGSTDRTVEIVKKYEGRYNVRVYSEKDNGMYDAIAKGFEKATGDIFCWLNSDDMLMPWAFEVMQAVISKTPAQWCMGIPSHWTVDNINFSQFKPNTYLRYTLKKGYHDNRVLPCVQQESTFWTRDLWEKSSDKFNIREYKSAGDFHLWKSFAEHEQLYRINSVISGFRHHENQKSADTDLYYKEVDNDTILTRIYRKTYLLRIFNAFIGVFNYKNQININDIMKG